MLLTESLPPLSSSHAAGSCLDAVTAAIAEAGGWLRFDDYLTLVLQHPHYGYYGSGRAQLGAGGDFYTAPVLSPLFAEALARFITPYLKNNGAVLELGAGDGTLARQLLPLLPRDCRYLILETSAALAARQQHQLQPLTADRDINWLTELPLTHHGFIIANEVLDCVPFRLLRREQAQWRECGVIREQDTLQFSTRAVTDDIAAPLNGYCLPEGYQTEISPQAAALTRTLAACLTTGCLLFADYGYGRSEYYHPMRSEGTLRCFRAQRMDSLPLEAPGEKDITAHVDFTAIADAGLEDGCRLAGYVTQAQGLINSGITDILAAYQQDRLRYTRLVAGVQKLLAPQEMGEIIKWLGFIKGDVPPPAAFADGDISQRL